MKKYILPVLAAVIAFSSVSCTGDFLERNTNPEQATDEMLKHDNLSMGSYISQMIANVLPSYQRGEDEYGSASFQVVQGLTGNIFSNYEAASNAGFHQTNEYNLMADGWQKALFEDVFVRAAAPWTQIDRNRESQPAAAGLGDILKVAALHRVTDAYGPIPYTQLGSGAIHVSYDKQQDVYTAMFADLDNGISVLEAALARGEATMLKTYDNVFYGDVVKWIQFANTLRLRLALRVAYADEAMYKAQAEKALTCAEGFLEVDAMLHPGAAAWENPLYIIEYAFNDGDAKAGATIICYMNGYNDPRRPAYFTVGSDGEYHGVRMGATVNTEYPKSTLWSRINCTNNDPLLWMSGAESFFLRAEHALRSGNAAQAQSLYENGVRKSFELWGVSGADTYLAGTTGATGYTDPVTSSNSAGSSLTSTGVAWSSQSDFEGHLEQIITQKYIAGFPEGMEAWAEFRRTGYPKVIPTATNNSGGLIDTNTQIRRLIYPASEYSANGANVQEGVAILIGEAKDAASVKGDNGGTRLWWDQK